MSANFELSNSLGYIVIRRGFAYQIVNFGGINIFSFNNFVNLILPMCFINVFLQTQKIKEGSSSHFFVSLVFAIYRVLWEYTLFHRSII